MHAWLYWNKVNVATDTTGELWQKRLGDTLSQMGMQMLAEKECPLEVKNMHLEKCIDCLDNKQNKAASLPSLRRGEKFPWNWCTQMYAMWMQNHMPVHNTLSHSLMITAESCGILC